VSRDIGHGGGNSGQIGQIDLHVANIKTFAPKPFGGRVTEGRIAGTYQDAQPRLAELTCDLETDPFVGPRDEGDPVGSRHHDKLLSPNC
jgi:hypothetical protein